jgi:hypothetical protein
MAEVEARRRRDRPPYPTPAPTRRAAQDASRAPNPGSQPDPRFFLGLHQDRVDPAAGVAQLAGKAFDSRFH